MRTATRTTRIVAVLASAGLLLAACGGGDDGGGGDEGGGGDTGAGGGTFSIQISDPENPLVPGNTTESEGAEVVGSLWTGLVEYDPETTEIAYTGVAESIESEDSTTWTVTLNDGWTFHDGTPVNAESFVNAWNYTALSTNAFGGSYFMDKIEGYDDLQGEADDEGAEIAPPAATEMSGLVVEDDLTFTVTLSAPFAQFPITVGYSAFYPLPEAFFDDPEGFGEQPIGNGPFQAEEPFVPGAGITLTRYEDYSGENPAQADSVEYRVYTEINTAYTDAQAGNLDVTSIPPDAISSAPDEFGDRYIERDSSSFTYLGFPTYDPRFEDKRVRQAFSMAIDRQAISDAVFSGAQTPAYSAISPVVAGSRPDACQYCDVDVDAANALLDEAGFDRSQPVEWWFNAGAGHDEWVQAAANQVQDNLGLEADYVLRGDLQFSEYLPLAADRGFTGPFRLGWSMDYPSPQNYLEPLYSEAAFPPAGSNSAFYSNPEFDELISMGNQAASNDEAIALYQEAEDLLLEDMPIMPMFFGLGQFVHSENVSNVQIDAFGKVVAAGITVNQ